ncbi:glycosyltransferase [Pseudarthrobacter phenanthrenivorans]
MVHYDSVNTLKKTIQSLRNFLPASRIVVVDNSSSLVQLPNDLDAIVLDDGRNYGYAGGVNHGIRYAESELSSIREVLVCTHETIFRGNAIQTLLDTARAYPNGHVIGPRLVTRSESGEEVTWSNGGVYSFPLLYPKHRLRSSTGGTVSVKWVDGAAFVVDLATWKKLGGVPEEFFMYMEDVALGELCRRANVPVLVNLDAVVEQTANGPSRSLAIRNRVLLAQRYMRLDSRLIVLLDVFLRQIIMSIHPNRDVRAKSRESRDAVRATGDIYKSVGRLG